MQSFAGDAVTSVEALTGEAAVTVQSLTGHAVGSVHNMTGAMQTMTAHAVGEGEKRRRGAGPCLQRRVPSVCS